MSLPEPTALTPYGAPLPLVRTAVRLLSFRITREELARLDRRHFFLGLACAWAVGIGRYWDDPSADIVQHLGVGSVLYVLALSVFLWFLLAPLRPPGLSYPKLAAFVALTSPPAALYAIPVERVVSMNAAQQINLWFLVVVASYRVALLVFYLTRMLRFRWYAVVVTTLLPLAIIVTTLTLLNMERGVLQIMGGFRDPSAEAQASANAVLVMLTIIATIAAIPLLLAYVALVILDRLRPAAVTVPEAPSAERSAEANR